jgi:hypothetical protein
MAFAGWITTGAIFAASGYFNRQLVRLNSYRTPRITS